MYTGTGAIANILQDLQFPLEEYIILYLNTELVSEKKSNFRIEKNGLEYFLNVCNV